MICPHCGQQIESQKTCPCCGNATVFAHKIIYQSVGNAENVVQLSTTDQPVHPLHEREQEINLLTAETDNNAEQLPNEELAAKHNNPKNHPRGKNVSGWTKNDTKSNVSVRMLYTVTAALLMVSVFLLGYLVKAIVLTPEKEVSHSVETDAHDPIVENEPTEPVKISFDVTFFNGKYAVQNPQAIALNEVVPLPCDEDIVDADGTVWKFTAWNTAQDGSGVSVPAGIVFPFSLAEDVTLYARWEKKTVVNSEVNLADTLTNPAVQSGENDLPEKNTMGPAGSEAS